VGVRKGVTAQRRKGIAAQYQKENRQDKKDALTGFYVNHT